VQSPDRFRMRWGVRVLYVHEVHSVRGRAEEAFEEAIRDGWMPAIAAGDDARLLWYCTQIHGTGPAYTVLTLTAVRDGAAWERLALRLQSGDLRDWQTEPDGLRHDVTATVLLPVPWSPMQDVDFSTVPTTPGSHELSIYMEDTGWPHADLVDYIGFWCSGYHEPMQARP